MVVFIDRLPSHQAMEIETYPGADLAGANFARIELIIGRGKDVLAHVENLRLLAGGADRANLETRLANIARRPEKETSYG